MRVCHSWSWRLRVQMLTLFSQQWIWHLPWTCVKKRAEDRLNSFQMVQIYRHSSECLWIRGQTCRAQNVGRWRAAIARHEEASIRWAAIKFLRRTNSRRLLDFGEWLWWNQCADVDQLPLYQWWVRRECWEASTVRASVLVNSGENEHGRKTGSSLLLNIKPIIASQGRRFPAYALHHNKTMRWPASSYCKHLHFSPLCPTVFL